jgi:hypothetical protein
MAFLSVFLKSSIVFTFLIMPSALITPSGTLMSQVSVCASDDASWGTPYELLVSALPRICILVLVAESACGRGSYKPRTGRDESSSLS